MDIPWNLVNMIKYRADFPETLPFGSIITVYRQDIKLLINLLEKVDYESREIRSRKTS